MTGKNEHITEELVEQIAIISYEQIRVRNSELPMPSWTGAGAMTRYQAKRDVLGVLKLVTPVLIEQGWAPPKEATELRDALERASTLLVGETAQRRDGATENYNETIRRTIGTSRAGDAR